MKSFCDYLGLSNSCSYDVDDVIGRADRFGFQNFCSPGLDSWHSIDTTIWVMPWEKRFMPYANNKGADQYVHPRSLISAFVVHCLDSIIPLVSISKIPSLYLTSIDVQAGLSLPLLQTPKTGFLATSLICDQVNISKQQMNQTFVEFRIFFNWKQNACFSETSLPDVTMWFIQQLGQKL